MKVATVICFTACILIMLQESKCAKKRNYHRQLDKRVKRDEGWDLLVENVNNEKRELGGYRVGYEDGMKRDKRKGANSRKPMACCK